MGTLCPTVIIATLLATLPASALAAVDASGVQEHANYLWTLLAAALVFFMQAGFALAEAGLTRARNAVNIMMKNLMDFSIGSLVFWCVGFGLMFGKSAGGLVGISHFFMTDAFLPGNEWHLAFWMFQAVFAATAATIVSGAMAERMNFAAYLLVSAGLTALIYPIFGSWAWGSLFAGNGWLERLGFIDFAGSTVVHSIGAWAALAGVITIGPRVGKYRKDGTIRPILGHNMPLAALGVFILWLGWFGFNAGSTTTADKSIAAIFVTTNLSACAGAVTAMFVSWIKFGKPEIGMSLNGVLAGLVGITAGCANVSPTSAILIGTVSGMLVVLSVLLFERIRIDDPVGAISVHGVCGAWGTLAAGLFNHGGTSLSIIGVQILGILAAFGWAFPTSLLLFRLVDRLVGLRVPPEEEIEGLDIVEHGGNAYPEFPIRGAGSMGSGVPNASQILPPTSLFLSPAEDGRSPFE